MTPSLHRLSNVSNSFRPSKKDQAWPYPPLPQDYTLYSNDAFHSDSKIKLQVSSISFSSSLQSAHANPLDEQHLANTRPACFRNVFEEVVFVFTVMMAVSCTTFLQGVIVINTATIGRSLDMNPAEITWIAAAIGLGSGSFMLLFGKTADLVGHKPQLLLGTTWLAAWSLATAFVPTAITMNLFCGMLGIGTAIISPPAIGAMFATYAPGKRRNFVTGALGTANPVGFVIGSMSSALLTKRWDWRASFIFLAVFFAVITVAACWTMPAAERERGIRLALRRFDYLGTVLTIFGIGLVTFALSQGPEAGWSTAVFIAPLVTGIACVLGFTIWEHIYTHPLLDPRIWRSRDFSLCVLAVLFGYGSFATSQFWISLYMQRVQLLSGIQIATRLATQVVAGITWSFIGQYLVSRVNGPLIMGVGAISYLAGTLLLIFVRAETSYWHFLFPSLIITVIGADFQFIVSNLFVNTQMPSPSQAALGAGVLQTAMRIAIALGLAASTAAYGPSSTVAPAAIDPHAASTTRPYTRALLCAVGFAAVGVACVPFMRIGTMGAGRVKEEGEEVASSRVDDEKGVSEERDEVSAPAAVAVGGEVAGRGVHGP